ncbi:MAG: hypothetical protein DRI30_00570 [Chloroflexi bacterium]|nr:MAG: hypothetical protein DRI30_00570 [Chloroflexota bacterium]
MLNWFTASPLRTAIVVSASLVGVVVIFSMVMSVLAFSDGPGQCTPGGGQITINPANAAIFDQKWDAMDATLASGSPASITLNESELSSRADQFFTHESALDLRDVRVCIHDGYAEATGSLDAILGLQVEVKLKGSVDLAGDAPKTDIDDIDFGQVPGWLIDVTDAIFGVESDIDQAFEDVELKHTYTVTMTEGQVQIDGTP